MGSTQFMVEGEQHPAHLGFSFVQFLEQEMFVDVTLKMDTQIMRVHGAVLAAFSPYFERILQIEGMNIEIELHNMQFSVLKSVIDFMYRGKAFIDEDDLGAFLDAGQFFQVKGLTEMSEEILHLLGNPKAAVNGDASKTTFISCPKRVGMQQAIMNTTVLKTQRTSPATYSHNRNDFVQAVPTKIDIEVVTKPAVVTSPKTHHQRRQSANKSRKRALHTVSKSVPFQHNISGHVTTVNPLKIRSVDSSVAKEMVNHVPSMSPNGGVIPATVMLGNVETSTEDVRMFPSVATASQVLYMAEPPCKMGHRTMKQMNVLSRDNFTDVDTALHTETEVSRNALGMLHQQIFTNQLDSKVPGSTGAMASTLISTTDTRSNVSNISISSSKCSREVTDEHVIHDISKVPTSLAPIQTHSAVKPSRKLAQTKISANRTAHTKLDAMPNTAYRSFDSTVIDYEKSAVRHIMEISSDANYSTSNVKTVLFEEENAALAQQTEIPMETETSEEVYQLIEKSVTKNDGKNNEYLVANNSGEQDVSWKSICKDILCPWASTMDATENDITSHSLEVLKESDLPTYFPSFSNRGDHVYMTVNEEYFMKMVKEGVPLFYCSEGTVIGDGGELSVKEYVEKVASAQAMEEDCNSVEGTKEKNITSDGTAETSPFVAEGEETYLERNDESSMDLVEIHENTAQETESNVFKAAVEGLTSPICMTSPHIFNAHIESSLEITEQKGLMGVSGKEIMDVNEEEYMNTTEGENGTIHSGILIEEPEPEMSCRYDEVVTYDLGSGCGFHDGWINNQGDDQDQRVIDEKECYEDEGNEGKEKTEQFVDVATRTTKLESSEISVEDVLRQMMGESSETEMYLSDKINVSEYTDGKDLQIASATSTSTMTTTTTTTSASTTTTTTNNKHRTAEHEVQELLSILGPEEPQLGVVKECISERTADSENTESMLKLEHNVASEETNNRSTKLERNEHADAPVYSNTLGEQDSLPRVIRSEELSTDMASPTIMPSEELPSGIELNTSLPSEELASGIISQGLTPYKESAAEREEFKSYGETSQYETSAAHYEPLECSAPTYEKTNYLLYECIAKKMKEFAPHLKYLHIPTSLVKSNKLDGNTKSKDGAGTSSNMDILFTVGLWPVQHALEIFQAMVDFKPRRTRSSCAGAKRVSYAPPPREKRKASSTKKTSKKLNMKNK